MSTSQPDEPAGEPLEDLGRRGVALWRLYAQVGAGVAVRSTYRKLVAELEPCPTAMYVGKVKYLDFSEDAVEHWLPDAPFIIKRASFAHENEVRAVIAAEFPVKDIVVGQEPIPDQKAILVPVELDSLVDAVRVAPQAEPWLVDVIRAVSENFGFHPAVEQSNLDIDPVF